MQTASRQDEPGRHLARIFIAAQSVGSSPIGRRRQGADPFLGQPWSARPIEHEGDEVTGLVGLILIVVPLDEIRSARKKVVQLGDEKVLASVQFDQARNVEGHKPADLIDGGLYDRFVGEVVGRQAFPWDKIAGGIPGTKPTLPIGPGVLARQVISPGLRGIEEFLISLCAVGIFLRVIRLAEGGGQLGKIPGIVFILQRAGKFFGLIAEGAVAVFFAGIHCVFIGLRHIVIPDALLVGIIKDVDFRTPIHLACVAIHQFPAVEVMRSILPGQFHHAVDLIVDDSRRNEGQQRVLASKDVPAAENGALGEVRDAVDLTIAARIIAIEIGEDPWVEQGMIERGVKGRFLVLGAAFDGHPAQGRRPRLAGLLAYAIEVPGGNFRGEIGACAVDADEGNARLEENGVLVPGRKLGIEAEMLSLALPATGKLFRVLAGRDKVGVLQDIVIGPGRKRRAPHTHVLQRSAELGMIVDRILDVALPMAKTSAFRRAIDLPLDRVVTHDLHRLMQRRASDPPGQVDLNPRLRVLGKREAKDAAMRSSGHLGPDLVVVQRHGVVPGLGDFRGFGVGRQIAGARLIGHAIPGFQRPGGRHDHEIAQFSKPAHPAHMGKTEALDGGIGIGVAGPVAARVGNGVRAELHHPAGRGRTGKSLAIKALEPGIKIELRKNGGIFRHARASSPDKRIDIINRVFGV